MKKISVAIIATMAIATSFFVTGCQKEPDKYGAIGNESAPSSEFTDISDHWASDYIRDLSDRGLLSGYPDKTFRPKNLITREEAAQVLSNYAGEVPTDVPVPSDSQDRWSTPAIQNLLGQQIITGYPDGTFRPLDNITRAEFSKMVYQVLYGDGNLDPSITMQFKDLSGHWAETEVKTLAGNGIVKGYPDGNFAPEENITRAEASALISLALREYMNSTVYYLKDSGTEMYLVREVHRVEKTEGVARAALEELISGTVLTPEAFKVMPQETEILSIDIESGLATVDFSEEVLEAKVGASGESLGIASIVNTLTEFPTIDQVQFTVEGSAENGLNWWGHVGLYNQPFERNLSKVYEPVIWVESPVANQTVSSPLTIRGNARVFEATVNFRLRNSDGDILDEGFTMASSGAPDRGDFLGELDFVPSPSGRGQIEVFEISPKDGSEINKVIIPVKW